MEHRVFQEYFQFNTEKMAKNSLFSTPNMFCDLYCLEPGQSQKVHSHSSSDKVYVTIEGSPTAIIGDEERVLRPQEACLAPTGVPHGLRNDSGERAVLLVMTTPPPR